MGRIGLYSTIVLELPLLRLSQKSVEARLMVDELMRHVYPLDRGAAAERTSRAADAS